MKRAVLYLRSSKDQRDVSIQSQRHELSEIADRRGLVIVGEYADAVESGKDWDRPAFQKLIREIRNPARGWTAVLTKDTSRIARRRNLALIFEESECAINGVEVIYANMPESGDPATVMILRTLLQAMDEWHSLTSREKGLAGMAETVRQGFRAAGFAPMGYQLRKVDIGLVRDGAPVQKTVLEPSEDAPKLRKFLELRAGGIPRTAAGQAAGLPCSASTLVGVEWNALAYAGCTTFGVFHERTSSGGYKTKRKRRPRSEWMVQEDTHPALISKAQAETIIAALENSSHAVATSRGKAMMSRYLLTSILFTPAGVPWGGNRGAHYTVPRAGGTKNRYVPTAVVDKAVLQQFLADLRSASFIEDMLRQRRNAGPDHKPAIKRMQKRIAEIAIQIDRAAGLALELEDPAPYHRKIDAMERERKALIAEQQALAAEMKMAEATRSITAEELATVMDEFAASIESAPHEQLKITIRRFVSRVILDPDNLECRVEYAVPVADRASGPINPEAVALLPGFEPGLKP